MPVSNSSHWNCDRFTVHCWQNFLCFFSCCGYLENLYSVGPQKGKARGATYSTVEYATSNVNVQSCWAVQVCDWSCIRNFTPCLIGNFCSHYHSSGKSQYIAALKVTKQIHQPKEKATTISKVTSDFVPLCSSFENSWKKLSHEMFW